VYVIEDLH